MSYVINDPSSSELCRIFAQANCCDEIEDDCDASDIDASDYKDDMCKILKMIKCLNDDVKCLKKTKVEKEKVRLICKKIAQLEKKCCDEEECDCSECQPDCNPDPDPSCGINDSIKSYIDYEMNKKFDEVVAILDKRLEDIESSISTLRKAVYRHKVSVSTGSVVLGSKCPGKKC